MHAFFTKESIKSFKSFVDWNVPVGKEVKSLARIYFGERGHYVDLIMIAGKQIYQGRRIKSAAILPSCFQLPKRSLSGHPR